MIRTGWPALLLLAIAVAAQVPDAVRFVDVALEAGLKDVLYCGGDRTKNYIVETLGTGSAFIDYDNDGDLDVFLVNASKLEGFPKGQEPTNHLYRNEGSGKFKDVTREAGLLRSGWGQGVCAGDINNDGHTDLFVTYWGHDVLYRNTGTGSFEDVTEAAGLKTEAVRWGTGCSFFDFDKDGRLDLLVANYVQFDQKNTPTPDMQNACRWKDMKVMCGPRGLKGGVNRLWRNESQAGGRVRFADVSVPSKITEPGERFSLSVTTLDYDNDGWTDAYVAVDSQASILYRNNHDGTFTDTGVETGVALSEDGREQAGMGTTAGDYNGDGHVDLAKTNFIDDTPNVYRNNGDGSFTEMTGAAGLGSITKYLGWGIAFVDYDNDTWPDLFAVNGHVYPDADGGFFQRRLLFRNLGSGRFQDVSLTSGDGVSAERSSRGLAAGDFDNDGDVDLLVTNMNDRPSLIRNDGGNRKGFLSVRLIGTKSNRSAIGAKVKAVVGNRALFNEVRSGSTFMSQSDFRLHFGIGSAKSVERLEIQWPSGAKETVSAVEGNRFITIIEGKGISPVKERR